MRILFVAMADSIHVVRWISQLSQSRHELFLFPAVEDAMVHPRIYDLKVKLQIPFYLRNKKSCGKVASVLRRAVKQFFRRFTGSSAEKRLATIIKKLKPDLIHSLETQHAGYLVYSIKKRFFHNERFPLWLHTNWGSDIYLFGRLSDHKEHVKQVLAECDYYSCESKRDVELAKQYGFSKYCFDPFPNTGGLNIQEALILRCNIRTSKRRTIFLKGYQGWAGRALFALKALEMIQESLSGFCVKIFGNPNGVDIKIAAELLSQKTGVPIEILPYIYDHSDMLRLFAESRIYIGLSISDSISTSLLEAMAMGTFPIQSDTSTASEWVEDGVSGYIVPAEDSALISQRIKQALTDDKLVDEAAESNWTTIAERLDENTLSRKTLDMYERIESDLR